MSWCGSKNGSANGLRQWYHQFAKKRLQTWQPILTPLFTIPLYLFFGILFVLVGIVLTLVSSNVVEIVHDYTDNPTDGNGVGHFEFELTQDFKPPVWIQYDLSGFYQNHRRYIQSYDYDQLSQGNEHRTSVESRRRRTYSTCEPERAGADGRVLFPCGMVARTVFNDSFVVVQRTVDSDDWKPVVVDTDATTIAWAADLQGRYRNKDPESMDETTPLQAKYDMWILKNFPPVECHQTNFSAAKPWVLVTVALRNNSLGGYLNSESEIVDCEGYFSTQPTCNFTRMGRPFSCTGDYQRVYPRSWGVESGHLAVWMRIAGLPHFRKTWGKVAEPLKAGTVLKVFFVDNFPARKFQGRKALVFSTTANIGGKDDYLGYGFLLVGACSLIFGAWKFSQCLYAPRRLGDISFLAPQK